MKKIRLAVIGCGYLGRFHALKYKEIDGVDLVSVCDLKKDIGLSLSKECNTEFCENYEDLKNKVDAVSIATDTTTHYKITKFFLENSIHSLVEKPITSKSSEGKELIKIAKENHVKLQVGHVERFNPAFIAIKEKLTNTKFIESHRLAPFKKRGCDVDVVHDLMIHDLDVILSLVKSRPINISASGVKILTNSIDIANARIEFGNGTVVNTTASRVTKAMQRKFRIFQDNQYISIDFGERTIKLITSIGGNLEESSLAFEKSDALKEELSSFIFSIRNNTPCEVSGEDGVEALKLAEKILDDITRSSKN
ncbi:MAG: hypothetical protein CBC38_02665 [Gammaproteobacteria bacterium TMED78]|nr:MAG: hypothetical protein CBC38_02665 [Gammaproteobacteria bacterium TMED78]|tara:strand:+ start:8846 stop:9772 length:927 start_codon:yes stop_codon:yes gene_type:complete